MQYLNKKMQQYILVFLTLFFCSVVNGASLDASVNRTVVSSGESLTLTLVADGVTGQPDLSPLEGDFEVLGTSTRREVTIVNGELSDLQSWDVELMPQRIGKIVIPALNLEGSSSQPVEIEVVEGTAGTAEGKTRDTFVEIEVDTESPFVQSQVLYTIRFYSAIRINEADLTAPSSESLTIRRLGEDTGYFQQRNGRRYQVIERRYAMFPRESGTIIIPPTSLKLVVPDVNDPSGGFFGRVSRVSVLSESVELAVRARPESDSTTATGNWWLPSAAVQLEAVWEDPPAEFRVGEPITRRVTLTARGVTGEQLPELTQPTFDGLKIYGDKPELIEEPAADALNARRIDKYAVIPQQPGEITLPEIRVGWFDTVSETYREATVEAETIQVVSNGAAGGDERVADNSSSNASNRSSNNATVTDQNNNTEDTDAIGLLPGSDSGGLSDSASSATDSTAGGTNPDNASGVGGRDAVAGFWKKLALGLTVAWFITLGIAVWLAMRWRKLQRDVKTIGTNPSHQEQTSRQAMQELKQNIAGDTSLTHIAASILAWARTRWPNDPPRSLQALAERYPSSESPVAGQLQGIEKALYSADPQTVSAVTSSDLMHQLPRLLESSATDESFVETDGLSPKASQQISALWGKPAVSAENRLPQL